MKLGDFALGSPESRAAARAALERRLASRERFTLILSTDDDPDCKECALENGAKGQTEGWEDHQGPAASRPPTLRSGGSLSCNGWIQRALSTRACLEALPHCTMPIAIGRLPEVAILAIRRHSSGYWQSWASSWERLKGPC